MSRWELFELSHFGEVKGAVGAYGSLIARVQRWAAIVSKVTVRGPRAAHPMLCAVSDEKFEIIDIVSIFSQLYHRVKLDLE